MTATPTPAPAGEPRQYKILVREATIRVAKQAVEKAGTTEVDAVRKAMAGQTFKAPSGFPVKMDEENHHLHKPVFMGEVQADGQFDIVWKTNGPIRAEPWSPYIKE